MIGSQREILNNLIQHYLKFKCPDKEIDKFKYNVENNEILSKYFGKVFGYVIFFYQNQTNQIELNENVNITKLENLSIMPPFKNNLNFKITVYSQSDCLILYKIGRENNCSFACLFSSTPILIENISDEELIQLSFKKWKKKKNYKNLNIFTYQYKGGTAFLIENFDKKFPFVDKILFKNT